MLKDALTTVKTSYSYTAQFIGNTADPCFTKGKLNGSANVFVTGNSFFFDYSELKNGTDLKFLNKFFNGRTGGDTFNFSSGTYYEPTTGSQITWNGTFTIQGKTGTYNQYILCSGVTGTAALTAGYYVNKNFTSPIQFTATTGNTANILISKTPRNTPLNLDYLGIYGSDYGLEEYVEVVESASNKGRLTLKNFVKLNDETEVVYVTNSLTNENLFFNKSTINLVQRGIPSLEVLASTEIQNGVTKITDATTGNISLLLENQNTYQYDLKQKNNTTQNCYYYPNSTLKSITINTENLSDYKNLSFFYSKIYILTTQTVYNLVYNSEGFNISEFVGFNNSEDRIYINGNQTDIFEITKASVILPMKFDLSDASNRGSVIQLFTDFQCTQPLISDYYLTGSPGYEGSAFIYFANRPTSVSNIYIRCIKNTTNIIQISISV